MHTNGPSVSARLRKRSGLPHVSRIHQLCLTLSVQPAQTLLVFDPSWVRYLTGFAGSFGFLVLEVSTSASGLLCTDSRYREDAAHVLAANELDGIFELSLDAPITATLARLRPRRLALLGTPPSWDVARTILSIDPDAIDALPHVWPLRAVKDAHEIEALRRAASIADQAMDEVLAELAAGPLTELELAARFEYLARHLGAESVAFPTIVAASDHASQPHAHPTQRLINPSDLLLVDFGATVDGYRSDATRTLLPPSGSNRERASELWSVVAAAQQAGIDAAQPGATPREVEAAARAVLREAGVESLLLHGVGHGVGLDIHERPFTARDDRPLAAGTLLTVEPGVYVPHEFGIRLEDTILITANGPEVITGGAQRSQLRDLRAR